VKTAFILLLLLLSSGCQSVEPKTSLRWLFDEEQKFEYKTTTSKIDVDDRFTTSGFKILSDQNIRQQVKQDLTDYSIPIGTIETTLSKNDTGFRVKSVSIKPDYLSPAKSEAEKYQREFANNRAGYVEILADLDKYGDNLSFFLNQQQRNFLTFVFSLPKKELQVGDSWSLPVNLLNISNGFISSSTKKKSKVTLEKIRKDKNGNTIAELFYVLAEKIEGQFEYSATDVQPLTTEYTYTAYATFNMNKGRWDKYVGISYQNGTGLMAVENMTIYALLP